MINGRRVLGLITARGGSRGLPGKNIREVRGRPLIAWTLEAAKGSKYLDRTVISTDDDAIRRVAVDLGCEAPFKREARLATDTASSADVVLDALDRCPGFDYVVLLQPTSPLRTAMDIDGALDRCESTGAAACVSVCEVEQNPFWMFKVGSDHLMSPLVAGPVPSRRQDLPRVVALNGAVYVAKVAEFRLAKSFLTDRTAAYEMPAERSIDIDTEDDLKAFASRLG